MLMFHYLKREFESVFIHRFSNSTMPFQRIFYNCTYYWGFGGIFIGYFLFHPLYTDYEMPVACHFGILGFYLLAQFMNFRTHLILRNLRKPGTKDRGIPEGCGFGYVSCANYLWEILAWTIFALYSKCITSLFFLALMLFTLQDWAMQRHRRYKKEFEKYPKNRKALIPFVF